jgi:hypothetical protein
LSAALAHFTAKEIECLDSERKRPIDYAKCSDSISFSDRQLVPHVAAIQNGSGPDHLNPALLQSFRVRVKMG